MTIGQLLNGIIFDEFTSDDKALLLNLVTPPALSLATSPDLRAIHQTHAFRRRASLVVWWPSGKGQPRNLRLIQPGCA